MRIPLVPVALLSVTLIAAAPKGEPATFVLERLNGTYTDLGGDLADIQNGPITVRPSSESNRFELRGHRLVLTPGGGGEHDAQFWVHFEGEAQVRAEMLMAGFTAGVLQDQVIVPDQQRTIVSRIKVERRPEDYLITIVDAPKDFGVTIQSALVERIVSMCKTLTRFTFGSSCGPLEASLSNPRIPMPEPGKELVLGAGQLTPGEQEQLDAYLAQSG